MGKKRQKPLKKAPKMGHFGDPSRTRTCNGNLGAMFESGCAHHNLKNRNSYENFT